jgi:hypothetical protein
VPDRHRLPTGILAASCARVPAATDLEKDPLTWDLPVHPDGIVVGSVSGLLLWTPTEGRVAVVRPDRPRASPL